MNQIELATFEDRKYGIDKWARLFNSTTWEELRMCADDNEALNSAVNDIYRYNSDWAVREQCEAREAYYARQAYQENKIKELTARLEENAVQMEENTLQLKENAIQLKAIEQQLKEKDAEIARLRAMLEES
ncbi:MAG: hypothetical protein ACI4EN_00345 [Butyrivibrio sp.]